MLSTGLVWGNAIDKKGAHAAAHREQRKGERAPQRPNQSPIRGGGDHQVMMIRKVMAMRMMKTMMAMKVQDVESMMRQLVLLSIKWWP